jgi:AraC-like DNA-binding protein
MSITIEKSHLHQAFYEPNFADVFLTNFGYDDFNYVKPAKYPSKRDRFALHYVFRGKGELYIEGKRFDVHEKQFFFVPKDIDVCYYPDENDKWAYAWFCYDGNASDYLNSKMGLSKDTPVRDASETFNGEVVREVAFDLEEMGSISYFSVLSAFYECVEVLAKKERSVTPIGNIARDAMRIIESNYADGDFNVESIANLLHISHSYLSKIFKKKTGDTLNKYLIYVRIKKAAELLTETDLSAKEIAFRVGYNDDIHFLKAFKSYFGKTTKEYRKEIKGQ